MPLSYGTQASSKAYNSSISIDTVEPNEVIVVFLGVWGNDSFSATAVKVDGVNATFRTKAYNPNAAAAAVYDIVVPNPGTHTISWTQPTNGYSIDIMQAFSIRGNAEFDSFGSAAGIVNISLSAHQNGLVGIFGQVNGGTAPNVPTVDSGEAVTSRRSDFFGNQNSYRLSTFAPSSDGSKTVRTAVRDSSSEIALVVAYKVANLAPSLEVTAPVASEQIDPRLPFDVTWNYSDPEGAVQAQREVAWKLSSDSVYSTIASGASNSSSFSIPANTLPDDSDIDIRVKVNDGVNWTTKVVSVRSDSWTYGPEVTSSVASGAIDLTGSSGLYEAEVRTADAVEFGPWSAPSNQFAAIQEGNVDAPPGVATLDTAAPSTGVGQSVYAVAGGVITLVAISPVPTAEIEIAPASPVIVLESSLEQYLGGAYTLHNVPAAAVITLPGGGPITIYWNGLFAVPAEITLDVVAPTQTVYIMPTAPIYTDLQYRAKFSEGFTTVTRRVEILEADGATLWDDKVGNKSRLISGNVSVDYTRDERRSADIELANFDKALIHKPGKFWYDKTIRMWRGIEFYDESGLRSYEVPVGVFMIDRINEARFPRTVKITARDYTKKCLLSKFTAATGFTADQLVEDVIASLASNAGVHDRILPATGKTLGVDTFFERGKSRWEAMKEIATAFGYELFFDAQGYLVMREFLDPTLSPVSHEFLTGPKVGNLVDWDKSSNDTRIFNHISVIGADSDTIPVWADAYNTNPLSPTNIDILGDRVDTFESPLVTTFAQAQELADTFLKVSSLEEFEINMTSIVFPWLEAGEIVRFVNPEAVGNEPDRFLLTSFNVPMGLSPMGAVGRRVTIVS